MTHRMMSESDILRWKARWEIDAQEAVEARDESRWLLACGKVWTCEFILNLDLPHPMKRFPFLPSQRTDGGITEGH